MDTHIKSEPRSNGQCGGSGGVARHALGAAISVCAAVHVAVGTRCFNPGQIRGFSAGTGRQALFEIAARTRGPDTCRRVLATPIQGTPGRGDPKRN